MHFFPIVPYNVPRDDFAKYLEMYDSQAEALLASRDAEIHAEWDINARAPVMRELRGLHGREELGYTDAMTSRPTGDNARRHGVPRNALDFLDYTSVRYSDPNGDRAHSTHVPRNDLERLGYTSAMTSRPTGDNARRRGVPNNDLARMLVSHMRLEGAYNVDVFDPWTIGAVGQPLGADQTRVTNLQAGTDLVDARWAQRAANALLSMVGAAPIQVDGSVGTATMTALRFAMLRWYATVSNTAVAADTGQTNINGIPMPTKSGAGVSLAREFSGYLATLTQVADPPPVARPPQASPPPATDPTTPPPYVPLAPPSGGAASGGGLLVLFALGAGAWYLSKRR